MRVYWRNGTWSLDAESKDEKDALKLILGNLKFAPPSWEASSVTSGEDFPDGHDKQSILGVSVGEAVVEDFN